MDLKKVRSIRKKHKRMFLRKANVVSVGIGYKVVDGQTTKDLAVIVGVAKKIEKKKLAKDDLVPSAVDGVKTDVVETHIIVPHLETTIKHRPAMPGISIGHKNITAGTFGCVVRKSGSQFILSNNHVLANSNNAEESDEIWQPGPIDGGSSADKIALLEEFVQINFGDDPIEPPTCPFAKAAATTANAAAKALKRKHRLVAVQAADPNYVDAAIAYPVDDIIEDIPQIGTPSGVSSATLGEQVQKFGRTTQHTTGTVLQVDVTVSVSYGVGKIAIFEDQYMTGPMSQGGDSGSVVLNMNGKLVGLLFAGSDTTTIFSPIQKVFELLGVSL